jgi:alpha-methylacyl-CoA racemase
MNGPLDGATVVSLAVNLPGPYAAERLTAMGATTVKIEPPAGDPLHHVAPELYRKLSVGQDVRTVNLKEDDGRQSLEDLLASSDVFITAMRPAALRRLGLDDATERHPQLTHIEIVGYDGADSDRAGHDLTYQAAYGTLEPAMVPRVPVVDVLGGEEAVSAALVGVLEVSKGRLGRRHRVVLDRAAERAAAPAIHGLTGPGDPLGGADPRYGIYDASDGHVAIAMIEPHFWATFRTEFGAEATHGSLAALFVRRPVEEWLGIADRFDLPIAKVSASPSQHT